MAHAVGCCFLLDIPFNERLEARPYLRDVLGVHDHLGLSADQVLRGEAEDALSRMRGVEAAARKIRSEDEVRRRFSQEPVACFTLLKCEFSQFAVGNILKAPDDP